VAKFVVVLLVPLVLPVHDFVVDVLAVDDQVVIDVVDEVPRVSELLRHSLQLFQVCARRRFTRSQLVSNVSHNVTKLLNSVQNAVELFGFELIDDAPHAFPGVFGIPETFNSVGYFSLDRARHKSLEHLAHAEEREVDIGRLHGLKVVHLLFLLHVDLVKQLLPVVVKVEEELVVLHHLRLAVQKHGSGLAKVFSRVQPVTQAVIVQSFSDIFKDVDSVDNKRFGGFQKHLFGVKERLCHSLDLFVVVMVDFAAMVQHVSNVRNGETHLVDSLCDLLEGTVPVAAHSVFKMFLHGVRISDTLGNICHAVEVKGANKEAFNDTCNFLVTGVRSGIGGQSKS